jgi:hypothetical protein
MSYSYDEMQADDTTAMQWAKTAHMGACVFERMLGVGAVLSSGGVHGPDAASNTMQEARRCRVKGIPMCSSAVLRDDADHIPQSAVLDI